MRQLRPILSIFSVLALTILLPSCTSVNNMFGSKKPTAEQRVSQAPVQPIQSYPLQPVRPAGEKTKVALLLPLSGQHKDLGDTLLNAAQLSLFENGSEHLELLIEDTKGNPAAAAEKVQEVLAEGAELIIGPVFSHETQAVSPIAKSKNVPILSFSNNQDIAATGVYTLGFAPADQIRHLFAAANAHSLRNIAVMLPKSSYGDILRTTIAAQASESGIQIDQIIEYDPGTAQLGDQAASLKNRPIDAILIPEGGRTLKLLVSALTYHDVNLNQVRLLGTGQWDTPDIIQTQEAMGGWFASTPQDKRYQFEQRYHSQYGQRPARLATLAYDAISLACALVNSDQSRPFNNYVLTDQRGYAGIDGLFKLMPTGIVKRNLAVYEVAYTGLRPVTTPSTF